MNQKLKSFLLDVLGCIMIFGPFYGFGYVACLYNENGIIFFGSWIATFVYAKWIIKMLGDLFRKSKEQEKKKSGKKKDISTK